MGLFDWFKKPELKQNEFTAQVDRENLGNPLTIAQRVGDEIFKAYIPEFLYKPPYGFPRRVNLPYIKLLASNPYVFSVIKTLADEATSMDWEIRVKKEFQEDGVDYSEKVKEITKFFNNPNGNDESLNHLLRQLIFGICEIDSGVIVKVFNPFGDLKQIFVRDGATFLKNPDIYGYMGNRAEFIAPNNAQVVNPEDPHAKGQIRAYYDSVLSRDAAYFQYGWTAGSMPVPFGKREVVYIMQNPRPDSIYGRSPVEILGDVILTLVYGSTFNLDFFVNSGMPEGVITLIGAEQAHIKQFRQNFENQFKITDEYGKRRKKFFNYPIISQEVKFTPFQLLSKDLEIISQQTWFTKILWMAFGVNSDEMGFTETSNRAVASEQAKIFKRKAIKPLLSVIKYHFDSQIIPEFFDNEDFGDCPVEFAFNDYDVEEDLKLLQVLQIEKDLGIKTSEMIAKERGINIEELKKSKDEAMLEQQGYITMANGQEATEPEKQPGPEEIPKPEEKAKEKNPDKEIDEFIQKVGENFIKEIDKLDTM